MSTDTRVEVYGSDRAADGGRLQDVVDALDQADNDILSAELSLDGLDVYGDDGDMSQRDREDIAHEIAVARRALRNLGRIVLLHAQDLRDLAQEKDGAE